MTKSEELEEFEREMRRCSFRRLERFVNDTAQLVEEFTEHHRKRVMIVLKITNERIENESKNHNN